MDAGSVPGEMISSCHSLHPAPMMSTSTSVGVAVDNGSGNSALSANDRSTDDKSKAEDNANILGVLGWLG